MNHTVKIKLREKRDKYLSFARKLKKLWNMVVTAIPLVIAALGNDLQRFGKSTGRDGNREKN